jgi:hypothetical protein
MLCAPLFTFEKKIRFLFLFPSSSVTPDYSFMTIDYHLHLHYLLGLTTSIDTKMSNFTISVVLASIFALYVLGKLLAARSNAVEPLTVQVVTPKRYSPVAPAMVKPLRAPAPDVSPSVAGALQQLSISDSTADVDDLITAFSSFSMEAPPLKSCCKSCLFANLNAF